MNDQDRYRRAKERVAQLRDFYSHASIYGLVNGVLFTINMLTSPQDLWFVWPLMGWGIGLASHALGVFGVASLLGRDWEERKIGAILDQDQEGQRDRRQDATWPDLTT